MNDYLKRLDSKSVAILRRVSSCAGDAAVYIVGGCVRDLVLKRNVLDLDVVIEGDAIAAARRFASLVRGRITVYSQFGTATVVLTNGHAVDFTRARREQYPYPGSLPVVTEGSIRDDLARRDFTINALAISLDLENFGALLDLYGGLNDLKKKYVRILHEQSFLDDPTRILRAVRFEQRFQFRLEPNTLRLLRKALKQKAEATVKTQRYFAEFKKNLNEDQAADNLRRLSHLGAMGFLGFPFKIDRKNARTLRELSKTAVWAKKNLSDWDDANTWVHYMMLIIDGFSPARVTIALERFAIANVEKKKILSSLSSTRVLAQLAVRSLRPREVFESLRHLSVDELLFLRSKATHALVRAHIETHLLKWRHLKLHIDGNDLKRMGVPAGKTYKIILDEVLYALVEGKASSKSDQLMCARTIVQQR